MADQIPAKQYASGAITNYQRVRKLAEENMVSDSITFKRGTIDNTTMSEIRDAIANTATSYRYPSRVSNPQVMEYLKELFKTNMCNAVTIDYKKLNSYGEEGSEYATILRSKLQSILDKNTGRLYTYMTSNLTL